MASVTEPIWLTLSRRQSHAFLSIANWIRLTFVTVKSSLKTKNSILFFKFFSLKTVFYPTSCTLRPLTACRSVWKPFQSSWSKPSSIDIIGYCSICLR